MTLEELKHQRDELNAKIAKLTDLSIERVKELATTKDD